MARALAGARHRKAVAQAYISCWKALLVCSVIGAASQAPQALPEPGPLPAAETATGQ